MTRLSFSKTLLFVFFLGLASALFAAEKLDGITISQIKTAGNVSVKAIEILSKTRLRQGENFNSAVANKDAKRIAEISGVEYAYYNTVKNNDGNVVLTYVVVEKNLVRQIQYIGNNKIKSSILTKKAGLQRGDYLDIFLARSGVDKIKTYYLKKGYNFVEVSFDDSQIKNGKVIYLINEGPRVRLKKISFSGNDAIKRKTLKRGLSSRTRKWIFWPAYYNQSDVEKDIAKIETAYQKLGYINAKATPVINYKKDNKKAYLEFKIDQGKQYLVDVIEINGNTKFADEILFEKTKLTVGSYYNEQRADFDIEKIKKKYLENGYINTKVEKNRTFTSDGKVNLCFNVQESSQYKIGKIIISGNTATYDNVFRRVLDDADFVPGQIYNAHIARGSGKGSLETDVRRAAYAESSTITAIGSDPEFRDALLSIAEGQTGMILFGAGVGSNDGVVGQIVYEQKNFDISNTPRSWAEFISGEAFKGAGQKLKISFEPGTEVSRYEVSFSDPYFRDMPVKLDVSGSSFERDRETYSEERTRGYVGFTKRYKNNWYRGLAFSAENVNVSGVDLGAPVEITDDKGSNFLLGIKFLTGYSTVDNKYNPSKGRIFDMSYKQVGGDHTFGVLSATNRWYKTLYEDIAERKTILETKVHAASIIGEAPSFEKFYAGGTGSLRGFGYRGVSSRGTNTLTGAKNDEVIGSDWIISGNIELVRPIGAGTDTISTLVFLDATMVDSGTIRSSIGVGLQIMLPQWFGPVPMRFEIAAPITKEEYDDTQIFSFSVGRLF